MDPTWMARQQSGIDEAELRAVLSQFATGITIVTGRDQDGCPRAITVNAFASVSLDPPLVLYCLGKSAFNFETFANAKAFAVNILNADQEGLSDRFAREAEDDLADLAVGELATGCPILAESLGALDCQTEVIHEAGDHLIIVGRVVALRTPREADPLLYYRSRYLRVTP